MAILPTDFSLLGIELKRFLENIDEPLIADHLQEFNKVKSLPFIDAIYPEESTDLSEFDYLAHFISSRYTSKLSLNNSLDKLLLFSHLASAEKEDRYRVLNTVTNPPSLVESKKVVPRNYNNDEAKAFFISPTTTSSITLLFEDMFLQSLKDFQNGVEVDNSPVPLISQFTNKKLPEKYLAEYKLNDIDRASISTRLNFLLLTSSNFSDEITNFIKSGYNIATLREIRKSVDLYEKSEEYLREFLLSKFLKNYNPSPYFEKEEQVFLYSEIERTIQLAETKFIKAVLASESAGSEGKTLLDIVHTDLSSNLIHLFNGTKSAKLNYHKGGEDGILLIFYLELESNRNRVETAVSFIQHDCNLMEYFEKSEYNDPIRFKIVSLKIEWKLVTATPLYSEIPLEDPEDPSYVYDAPYYDSSNYDFEEYKKLDKGYLDLVVTNPRLYNVDLSYPKMKDMITINNVTYFLQNFNYLQLYDTFGI